MYVCSIYGLLLRRFHSIQFQRIVYTHQSCTYMYIATYTTLNQIRTDLLCSRNAFSEQNQIMPHTS